MKTIKVLTCECGEEVYDDDIVNADDSHLTCINCGIHHEFSNLKITAQCVITEKGLAALKEGKIK